MVRLGRIEVPPLKRAFPDPQPVDDRGVNVPLAFAFERRPLIRISPRALVSLQAWCSDINFEQIYLRVVLHEWQRGLGGFAGGEVQSGRWAGGPFGPLAGLLPHLTTGCGEATVTAFDPCTCEDMDSGPGCRLPVRSAMGPRRAC